MVKYQRAENFLNVRYFLVGNPGCARFYTDFADVLFTKLDCSIYVLSHAGMVNGAPWSAQETSDRNHMLLQSQIQQKGDILKGNGLNLFTVANCDYLIFGAK